jgi:aryl-alcohol dehydrogenase-like predicted oxidoreductase
VREPQALSEMKRTGHYAHGVNADVVRQMDALYAPSDESSSPLPELALRFLLSTPEIASAVPSPALRPWS